jgi:hypothetical protein
MTGYCDITPSSRHDPVPNGDSRLPRRKAFDDLPQYPGFTLDRRLLA